MTIKYEYTSKCCNHSYIEQRPEEDDMYYPKCNICGVEDYTLVKETRLA
jgi:hypothetical protein